MWTATNHISSTGIELCYNLALGEKKQVRMYYGSGTVGALGRQLTNAAGYAAAERRADIMTAIL